jgi:hypothetical protein
MSMLRKALVLLIPVMLAGTSCSVLSHEAPPQDVDKASTLFFQRLKAAEYEIIYNDAGSGFKENKTRNEVVDNLTKLTAGGRLLRYSRIGTFFNDQDKRRVATTSYRTDFEKNRGELKLYFVDESGEWKLDGFEFKLLG